MSVRITTRIKLWTPNFMVGSFNPFEISQVSVTSPQGSHAQPRTKIYVAGNNRQVQSLPGTFK
jgi:hypothetical protein